MVLINGSKNENLKLLQLISKQFRNLNGFYRASDVESVQSWLNKQPHLPKLTDKQIAVFLHASNYSVERTKETLDNYYTIRTRAPTIFTNRNPRKILAKSFEIGYFACMPEEAKTYEGNQIFIQKFRDPDPAKANFEELIKTSVAVADLVTAKYPFGEGFEIIFDMQGAVLAHLARIDFPALKAFLAFSQNALPFRLKAIHVINTFPLINQIMALLKPFLKAEFLSKISFYSPNEFDLLTTKHIPLSSLPSDFGGHLENLEKHQGETFRELEIATDWLKELESYKINEDKRLEKRNDFNMCDGSFKKLELD